MTMPAFIHEHPEEWLATALADGLSPEESRVLAEHLAGCERCRDLQADLAALDETLLRNFPAAVGPSGGFETRLVAGFRRRHGKSERLAKFRAMLGWLVRQRGAQFAGVVAALLGLVGLGQLLTSARPRASYVANDARIIDGAIDPSAIENNMVGDKAVSIEGLEKDFKPQARLVGQATPLEKRGASPNGQAESNKSLESTGGNLKSLGTFATGKPALGDISLGTDAVTFAGTGALDREKRDFDYRAPSLTLNGGNTYTGATTVTAGTLSINGVLDNKSKMAVDTRNQDASTKGSSDGFINYGWPIQPVSQNVAGEVAAPAAPSAATPAPPDVRKLIRNARAELEVASFDAAVDAVTAAATRDGGFLDTRNSARGGNGKVSGTLVAKVLPENLDRFLAGLRALGDLKNQTIQTEDVTKDYFDTDARLRNSRRMEDRLLKMLDEVKGKMAEVLQVEKELARVRADIETMQGQLKLYDAQVRYATVVLTVREKNLDQPAAFLLRETATLALLASDVERTAAEARRITDAAHAQVLRSELSRDPSGQWRATLRLLVGTDAATEVIAQVKTLGRVENYHLQDERIAQNGASSNEAGTDVAKVERAPVTLDITISHDEQISRQVGFTLVAADVEGVFEKARASAVAAGGEVVNANVAHAQNGHTSATLGVRVPGNAEAGLTAAWKSLGRAGNVETRRVESGSAGAGPVLISLNVEDSEPAVQQTSLRIQTNDVERRADEIKRDAAAGHVEVEASSFASEGNGRQRAGLKFRLPMSGYPAFVERLRGLGVVKEFVVQREDRPEAARDEGNAGAPVVIDLTLYSEGSVIGTESGLGATLRRTFGQGAGALTWSIQMIGVAVAFLAPWIAVLAVAVWAIRRYRRAVRSRDGKAS